MAPRRAAILQGNLKWLWSELAAWIAEERTRADSQFHTIRPLVLVTYAESMSRIGETIEMAFQNRKDRKTLEPAILRLLTEPDPSIAAILSELGKIKNADPPLQRALREFKADPFRCSGSYQSMREDSIQGALPQLIESAH